MNRRTAEESQPSKPTVEETVAALVESFQAFQTQYNEYKEDTESLAVTMNKLQNQVSAFSQNPTPNAPPNVPELRLAFFDGSNPLDWLFQAEQYFSFYRVPNEQRLSMIAFDMKGDALSWYKWMYSNHQFTNWDEFTRALEIRFMPNHQSALVKLRQNGSVADYQVAFEKLYAAPLITYSMHSVEDKAHVNGGAIDIIDMHMGSLEFYQRIETFVYYSGASLITYENFLTWRICVELQITSGDTPYTSAKIFEDLNLSPELLKGLYIEMQFEKPSEIQEISLPMILTAPYKHLIAQAQNGSGKTTCFVLGMLSRVDPKLIAPQALCICPTRELAIQVCAVICSSSVPFLLTLNYPSALLFTRENGYMLQNMEVLVKMGKFTGITSELAITADIGNYIPIQKRPPITAQVIIGTPGTISKWMIAKKLGMSQMKILVFDEADHMLAEGGFRDDSVKIMKAIVKCNSNCQVLLFSATFDDAVKAFVAKIVKEIFVGEYNQMFVKKEELSLESVKQYKVHCPDELSKIMVIKDRILELGEKVGQTIIFVRSRDSAMMLHKSLVTLGYEVTTIQGALKQEDRDKIIKEFKEGFTQVLISTDLLARGFDQRQVLISLAVVNLVVNFDLPVRYDSRPTAPDYDVYLHRVGRAGRFGRKGAVFNLLCEDRDDMIMAMIEEYFNTHIAEVSPWNSDKEFEVALEKAGLL
ncbi:hypothetical protein BUALT_Bualt11G0105000 [Buddleja alternifolia]|uniref:RNA helicase n=1 Tax=Buddleja alternifolia TaxID=168488 RepID=A0AAV6X0F1_9LAMI|nr:hypothetical protein BUALT_Bualt11G0105000 [Buddleja alternifolia]